ncbi:T9SS type A sorting domain-containing protein [Sanyastnella coralliicola]|uniref:T9SS type A sorting domain-containing protein n=1 Tax=Sanyastnella coralliicola TaxID=3069118 RepID=UPI0027BAF7F9|nr:T9SS type A sorting domain-containing protein [Longitalea sp. SCSIO 12813]
MKKLLLFCAAVCTGLMSFAQLNQIVVEEYTPAFGGVGEPIYRIYAEMGDASDIVSAVFAIDQCHPLDVSTTTDFFNDALGGINPSGINPAFFAVFPTIEADSWVTIGVDNSTQPGAADIGQASTVPADPFTGSVNTDPGANLLMDDGAWFTLPTSASALPTGVNNRVLLGQFTTDGDLSFNINLQVFVGGDQAAGRVDYVYDAACSGAGSQTGFESVESTLTFPNAIPGCTDPTACNFDPLATADDGTCIAAAANDNCSGAIALTSGVAVTVDNTNACGTPEILTIPAGTNGLGSCSSTDGWCSFETDVDNDLWYSFTTPANPAVVDVYTTETGDVDDTQMAIFDACGGNLVAANDDLTDFMAGLSFACGDLAANTTYYVMVDGYNGASGTFDLQVDIDEAACSNGCTDPNAINFDAGASVDDGSCIVPTCAPTTPDNFQYCYDSNESTQFVYTAANAGDEVIIEILAGSFETNFDDITIYDGVGNGGAVLFTGDGDVSGVIAVSTTGAITIEINSDVSVSCASGSQTELDYNVYCGVAAVLGCTDPLASNYDPLATVDDGSCIVCNDILVDVTVDGGGFPGEVSFDIVDSGANVVYSGTGNDGSFSLCLPAGCYQIDMFDSFGDGWNGANIDFSVGGSSIGNVELDSAPIGDGDNTGTDFVDVGNTGSCPVLGCTDATACNFDPAATLDDGSCIAAPCLNDLPSLAFALSMEALGSCNGYVGEDIAGATVQAPEATAFTSGAGLDLWYSFVPMTSGVRLEVNTADFDALIELQDAGNNPLDVEDVVFVNGGEVLNIGNLTAGDTYFVRVAPYFDVAGPALFDICAQSIPDTRCDYGPGPYDLCDIFKADWVGADDYIFNLTSQGDGSAYQYQAGGPNTFVVLSDIADLGWGDIYDVSINSVFDLTRGDGNTESIEVENDEPCTLEVNDQPLAALRESDNQANYGPHFLGDYIAATPYVCGVVDWTWEFVNTDGSQLPIIHLRGASNRYMRISDVAGLVEGAVYEVRVKPEFSNGAATNYGGVELLSIIGPAGIVGEIESPVVLADDAERLDVVEMGDLAIYPNPSNGDNVTINVSGIESEVVSIEVLDATGKLVRAEQIAATGANLTIQTSMSEFTSGLYTVRVIAGTNVMTERLQIVK